MGVLIASQGGQSSSMRRAHASWRQRRAVQGREEVTTSAPSSGLGGLTSLGGLGDLLSGLNLPI